MMLGFPLLIVLVGAGVVFFIRHGERAQRARFLRRAGFGLMACISFIIAAFVIGETFTDPGGWEALGLVCLWFVPLLGLGALAWFRPAWATWVFSGLIAVAIGASVWFAVDPEGWRRFEDRNGPIRSIGVFALSAAVTFLAVKRTRVAALMLLVLSAVPIAVSSLSTMGSGLGSVSLMVVSSPAFVAGGLLLWSSLLRPDRPAPPHTGETGPAHGSLAA
jgi:hypothetical protein